MTSHEGASTLGDMIMGTDAVRILLIDDDVELAEMLSAYLNREGFSVDVYHDGVSGLTAMTTSPTRPDLVILDVMLPRLDGFGVLKGMRDSIASPPVLMLTARGDDDDRIAGLELGADDYLPKPFNPRELVARVRAILRRITEAAGPSQEPFVVGSLSLDPARIEAQLAGITMMLTAAEFRILEFLARHLGQVVTRSDLTEHALARKLELYDRSIDTHVSNLRRKMNLTGVHGFEILGVRGVGYQLARPASPLKPS